MFKEQSKAISRQRLILIRREHDSSIWVSSSQRAYYPSPLRVGHTDARTSDIKIQTLNHVLFPHSLRKMDGSQAEARQCKSIPVEPCSNLKLMLCVA